MVMVCESKDKVFTIKADKCCLVVSQAELMNCLAAKPELFKRAISRGKGLRRAQSVERRLNHVDRWQLYEWLKGNRIPADVASLVETMNTTELREGVIEFLLMKRNG